MDKLYGETNTTTDGIIGTQTLPNINHNQIATGDPETVTSKNFGFGFRLYQPNHQDDKTNHSSNEGEPPVTTTSTPAPAKRRLRGNKLPPCFRPNTKAKLANSLDN
ncbi:hypothetical protein DFH28DRAFT_1127236 [Melampsora americana]|nr:hypothetical protein DFH28DRAFT_1127236 [Melampsora americana]